MNVILRWLSRLGRAERRMVLSMREIVHERQSGLERSEPSARALRLLVAEASACGYIFGDATSPNVTDDEIKLVGWLAIFQREYPAAPMLIDTRLLDMIELAAKATSTTCPLPFQVSVRASIASESDAALSIKQPFTAADSGRTYVRVGRHTIKAETVQFVRRQGTVSRDTLRSLGLSRQYLNVLCNSGALVRVQRGLFAAGLPRSGRTEAP